MKLPLLVSVPHAGLRVPQEVEPYCTLTPTEVAEDGDVGAAEIYAPLESKVQAYLTTDVARAIVDVNRAEDDRRKDGVVKTHTCWNVPVYHTPLPDDVVAALLTRYHHPYHAGLRELTRTGVRLGVDCHTMSAHGPPIGPDPGEERPWVCLSNGNGTCPREWIDKLRHCFETALGSPDVRINNPFQGGHIIRAHAGELPWVQIELSRAEFLSNLEKGCGVVDALTLWCEWAS